MLNLPKKPRSTVSIQELYYILAQVSITGVLNFVCRFSISQKITLLHMFVSNCSRFDVTDNTYYFITLCYMVGHY